jgi:hypothetical protein
MIENILKYFPYIYFSLSLISLILTAIGLTNFTIIVYPDDLREADRTYHETQIIAEKIMKNIDNTSPFPFRLSKIVVILLILLSCISFFNLYFIHFGKCFKEEKIEEEIQKNNSDDVRINVLQVYKNKDII